MRRERWKVEERIQATEFPSHLVLPLSTSALTTIMFASVTAAAAAAAEAASMGRAAPSEGGDSAGGVACSTAIRRTVLHYKVRHTGGMGGYVCERAGTTLAGNG